MRCSFLIAVTGTLILSVTAATLAADYDRPYPNVDELTRKYVGPIVSLSEQGEYREAIGKVADYELDILGLYPPSTYQMGLFQSEAEHISFHCPFVDWKRKDLGKEPELKKLTMMCCKFLFCAESADEEERLLLICIDGKQLEQRIGNQNPGPGPDFCSDRGLQIMAQLLAGNFGVVKAQEFRTVGDHRGLFLNIGSPMAGPDVRLVLLTHDRRIFAFLLITPARNLAVNEARLEELIKTLSFDYRPEDTEAITAERAGLDRKDVSSLLACVQRLARIGEYNAAGEHLAELRLLFHGRMPAAAVNGDVGSCPAYGLTLKNPNPNKWKLSIIKDGVLQGVLLEDQFSVHEEGIMVCVVDFLVSYGPQVVEMMSEDKQMNKEVLISAGRGVAMMLGEIESERLTPIKGSLAYEVIIVPNLPGVKARVQCINKSDYALLIILLGDKRNFDAKVAECDRIVAESVQFGNPTTAVAAPAVWSNFGSR